MLYALNFFNRLRSFYFSALDTSCTNVFFRNGSVLMFNRNLLKICFIRHRSLTVRVANSVTGKFALTANATYFTHTNNLRFGINQYFYNKYFTIFFNKKQPKYNKKTKKIDIKNKNNK